MNTIWFDGIEFTPLLDYEIVVKDYYISRCAKVLNYRTKKYLNAYENYRGKKEHGDFKSMRINFTTDGQPYWDKGHMYPAKGKNKDKVKRKMHLHQAVKQSWEPYRNYVNTLSREQLIELAMEACLIDHIDDDPRNNKIENLQYSTPMKNANDRKKWLLDNP